MDKFRDFLQQPFRAEMTAIDWTLFLGLVIIIVIFWNVILGHITAGIAK